VLRRLVLPALVALLVVPSASGALARVRVESRNATIFGANQPRVLATNAMAALEAASRTGDFYYHVASTSFGPYVDQIGRLGGTGSSGWVFKVNGASPPVGADQVTLSAGDVVLWYYADFTDQGGPPTLELRRLGGGCYRVSARNDAGTVVPATRAVLRVDARRVAVTGARACPGPHKSIVRATAPGMIRSNAVA
jgi:Domain of unknown function (DUF4430)